MIIPDVDLNQDYTYELQDMNKPYAVISQIPSIEFKVAIHTEDKSYSVDLSAINSVNKDGKIEVSLISREQSNTMEVRPDSGRIVEPVNTNDLKGNGYFNESLIPNDVSKTLQYNAGTLIHSDPGHCYIPDSFDKKQSLDLMERAAYSGWQEGMELDRAGNRDGIKKMIYGKYLTAMSKELQKDNYSAEDVQSVFNTLASPERDAALMVNTKTFGKILSHMEQSVLDSHDLRKNDELNRSVVRGNGEYLRTLSSMVQNVAPEQEVGKILQYNEGTLFSSNADHCYIPNDFNKNESLNFMRTVGSNVMALGRDGTVKNDDQIALGSYIISLEKRLSNGYTSKRDGSHKEYTAEQIQSVFNTIGERETALMGGMEKFNKVLNQFEKDLTVNREMRNVLTYYNMRNRADHAMPYVMSDEKTADVATIFKDYKLTDTKEAQQDMLVEVVLDFDKPSRNRSNSKGNIGVTL